MPAKERRIVRKVIAPGGRYVDDELPNGPERSSAWLEHLLWEQDVAGSNPVAPTIFPE
jgi:hypothetical protein